MKNTMELLAPAGDEAALRAAVCAGADAVYLGYSSFGARAAAANFDAEALAKAVDYAHLYHVRIYVTVNTLVKQSELSEAFNVLATIAACHADAVIVQDMGVLRLAREAFPSLALHASTQMGIHTAAGARLAREHGVSRVVLARECPLDVVASAAQTGVQTEVFVHGALCASVSGQCLLSSMAGGRSGNRGRCAQPCRQAVTLSGATSAFLSMKDLCLRDDLPALQNAGVTALKIEGRLKRPEYVAIVTGRYRKAIDALANGTFAPADKKEKNDLLQIFHRGGFTRGYIMGEEDASLCATERVGHGGVAIGKIVEMQNGLATVSLKTPLHDGDSLRVDSVTDVELRYSGPAVRDRATVRLRPGEYVRAEDTVYRTADAMQLSAAQAITEPPIPIRMRAAVNAGQPLRLTLDDGENTVTVTGEPAQTPLTRALTRAEIARSLGKLGDSPFSLSGEPQVETDGAFAPLGALNALRRDALAALASARRLAFLQAREEAPQRESAAQTGWENYADFLAGQCALYTDKDKSTGLVNREADLPHMLAIKGNGETTPATGVKATLVNTLAVSFHAADMGQEFLDAGANLLFYHPQDLRAQALRDELTQLPTGTWLALPPQLSDAAFDEIAPLLAANAGRLAGVVLGSVGQLGFPLPLPVALGDGVPIANREAAQELFTKDIAFATLWPELSRDDLHALWLDKSPTLLRVYGRERVMLLNHCPERVARGLRAGRAECALCRPEHRACASADAAFDDRKGFCFPLMRTRTREGCVINVYNALPTDLAKYDRKRQALGAGMLLSFTVETRAQQIEITQRYATLLRTGEAPETALPSTAGHFARGVQ